MLQKASMATTQTSLSHAVEIEFSVAMASEALNLLRQYFFHHSREAEGPCVGIVCSRQVAAAVASSRLDAYLHPRLSPEFDLETRPH